MQGKIAIIKYISQKITISILHLFRYFIYQDNVLGLLFMTVEYITGKTLYEIDVLCLSDELRLHLLNQLADIYIQLYHQQFDHIRAFILDGNNENFIVQASCFEQATIEREDRYYNPEKRYKYTLSIAQHLTTNLLPKKMFIAYTLLKPCYLGNVYWNLLDQAYYGEDSSKRVKNFFKLPLQKPLVEELQKKISKFEAFKQELEAAGLEPIAPELAKLKKQDLPSVKHEPAALQ
ncbi:uncharacterized protein CIMG_13221 [Coccidioides immitis RS]|uniref:Uncharacterized protein n=1 Tax=Coccidioides immitis (strain RS) TaxID=246410 RepID=A0A0E1S179_COCIM|nr:uncharacterized protein CIMG_13221 [Coccidioides immitis RS]EAS29632.2 hypothetical protein CIMG_13221 [Coccidioides immitis RS]